MQKIKNEFLGKRSFGGPESTMQVLSLWLMKKSRKVTNVNTDMQEERVSLPRSQTQLAQMDDDVFATSIVDRYSACPDSLNNMCLATFPVNYNVCYSISKDDDIAGIEEADEEEEINTDDIEHEKQFNIQPTIKLKHKLGYMRKRKQEAIL